MHACMRHCATVYSDLHTRTHTYIYAHVFITQHMHTCMLCMYVSMYFTCVRVVPASQTSYVHVYLNVCVYLCMYVVTDVHVLCVMLTCLTNFPSLVELFYHHSELKHVCMYVYVCMCVCVSSNCSVTGAS